MFIRFIRTNQIMSVMKRIAIALLLLGISTMIFAQGEEMKPMKFEGSTWYEVNYIDFKPGTLEDVKKIIKKYESASEASGTQAPKLMWFLTGKYDALVIWKLEGGPSALEWMVHENGIKWYTAFVEQQGSVEAAQKLEKKFQSYVASTERHYVRSDPSE